MCPTKMEAFWKMRFDPDVTGITPVSFCLYKGRIREKKSKIWVQKSEKHDDDNKDYYLIICY